MKNSVKGEHIFLDIYTVTQISEADYGCEETGHREPTALLKLLSEKGERYIEAAESVLEKQGIREGKKLIITPGGSLLRYLRVVAAVIRDEEKIFATARGYGEYKGWWEFPGGKIEEGESPKQALVREIREELTAGIEVEDLIATIEYDYPDFHLSMDCFYAKVISGQLILREAEDAGWFGREELSSLKWLPADRELIDIIMHGRAAAGV